MSRIQRIINPFVSNCHLFNPAKFIHTRIVYSDCIIQAIERDLPELFNELCVCHISGGRAPGLLRWCSYFSYDQYNGFRGKGQSLLVVDVAVDVTIDGLLRGLTILIGETIEHGHQSSNDEVLGHILGLQMIDDILYGVLIFHTISIKGLKDEVKLLLQLFRCC